MNTPTNIHLVFKTHLDVGFTDYAQKVKACYFQHHIPQAIAIARRLREERRAERLIWTTGSWLVFEYLEEGDSAARRALEGAIEAGDIVWHALPFTTHSELMDPTLFRYGLSLSQRLDTRFGRKTIAAKMTDVPGHTRAIVPLLAEAGVKLLHVGVNPASLAPEVPPVFVWRDPQGAEIMVVYQKGSYGDLVTVEGMRAALYFAHTNDNIGPQSFEQVLEVYCNLERRFPKAELFASTLDAYARDLAAVRGKLPVVENEVGDTWIHGVGSDPKKVGAFRELCRLRRAWLREGRISTNGKNGFDHFSRLLLMVPEHTWGLDEKTHLNDFTNYRRDDFKAARKRRAFRNFEASWQEQRDYLTQAVAALGDSQWGDQARACLERQTPRQPDLKGFKRVSEMERALQTRHFRLQIGADGAINALQALDGGRHWADAMHPLGLVRYEVYAKADYDRYYQRYIINKAQTREWSELDFAKPGIECAVKTRQTWALQLKALWRRDEADADVIVAELGAAMEASQEFGCPRHFFAEWRFPHAESRIELQLTWSRKAPCRVSEALWLTINPHLRGQVTCMLDKMGSAISPYDVIKNGNRRMHAVDSGLTLGDRRDTLTIETLDAPLVLLGELDLLDFHNRRPKLRQGVHFNLYNNVWGTNFPMWYDEDARFRFKFQFSPAPAAT
jgi:hypothetical protein